MSRFNFIGEVMIPKKESKRPFFREMTGGKTGRVKMAGLNFGIKASDNNMAFVESFDSVKDKVKTMDNDKNKIEVDWADRLDDEVVKTVANFKKYTVDLGEEHGGRNSFIAEYDFILFLKEHLPNYKGKVEITGQFKKEPYKGKYFDKFNVQCVYAADADKKSRLSLVMDVFYNKDSVDKADLKTEKKVYLNGYVSQYISKDEGNKFIPQQFVFNTSKYDVEHNEKHKKMLEYKMKYLDTKSKTMVHVPWEVVLLRGAEEAEFNESMLTASQKEQVELGIHDLEFFKPRGQIFGDKVNEYRLFDPQLTGDFADGLVSCDMTNKEFEDLVYAPPADEKLSDVVKKAKADDAKKDEPEEVADDKEPPFEVDSVDDDDLF